MGIKRTGAVVQCISVTYTERLLYQLQCKQRASAIYKGTVHICKQMVLIRGIVQYSSIWTILNECS